MNLLTKLLRLLPWRGRYPAALAQVTLYTRAGCHLCHEAEENLRNLRSECAFALEVIDIDQVGDAQLLSQHGDRVPVILLDGKPRLWGKISAAWLRRLILKECGPSRARSAAE